MRYETVLRLAAKALRAGGRRVSIGRVEWDISSNCEAPVLREIDGKADSFSSKWLEVEPSKDGAMVWGGIDLRPGQRHLTVALTARCRKCASCLRRRRNEWVDRALFEWGRSFRTWFCTFTFRAEEHYRMLTKVRREQRSRGVDWDTLDETQRFSLLHAACGREVELFLKRLRDGRHDDPACGVKHRPKVRYLQVVEKHTEALDGFPHYHAFIHECDDVGLSYAALRQAWGYAGNNSQNAPGFMEAKLVKSDAAAIYLTKYLGKNAEARVRCSAGYGVAPSRPSDQRERGEVRRSEEEGTSRPSSDLNQVRST